MGSFSGKTIVVNGAPSQYDRRLSALAADYAKPDGRSLAQLLNFSVEFARLIHFYNFQDEPEGDWEDFFRNDPAIMMAGIEAKEISKSEAEFQRLQDLTRQTQAFDPKFNLLRGNFQVILELARQVDSWLRGLSGSSEETPARLVREAIFVAIENDLAEQLRKLKSWDEGAALPGALGRPMGLDFSGFLPVWRLRGAGDDGSIYRGTTAARKMDNALPSLASVFFEFLYAIAGLKEQLTGNLAATLQSGRHTPNNALYIAFVQLFRTAQNTINTFSRRYINFYYRDLLREKNRGAIPDTVYLTFELAAEESITSAPVPRGTLFSAGNDTDGKDILYAADAAIAVTAAALQQIRTLRIVEGPLFAMQPPVPSPETVAQLVLGTEIIGGKAPWSTFGESQAGSTGAGVTRPATLGFAVASSYLLLTGGQRKVELKFDFSSPDLGQLLQRIAEATGLTQSEILCCVLQKAFSLYFSTAAGWLAADGYKIALQWEAKEEKGDFILTIELAAPAPAIAAFDPANVDEKDPAAKLVTADPVVNACNPDPQLPTLKAYLRQEAVALTPVVSVYPLSLLRSMKLGAVSISTFVQALPGLLLENTDGEIDPGIPFPLLGASPVVGSFFQVRAPELFVKTLTSLDLGIHWFNLPPKEDGFKGYYKYYDIGLDGRPDPNLFNNAVFRGKFSVVNPGSWSLPPVEPSKPDPPDLYLFRTKDKCKDSPPEPIGPLCPGTEFTIQVSASAPPAYYEPSSSALRLELTGPPYAFGNDLYAPNVLNAVVSDLPNTGECLEKCYAECQPLKDDPVEYRKCLNACLDRCMAVKKPLKYPNPPYLPQAISVSIGYEARCRLEFPAQPEGCGAYFHLLPFGGYREAQAATLLPQFSDGGNLYLGFSGMDLSGLAPAHKLTLLFQMAATAVKLGPEGAPPVKWEALCSNSWTELGPAQIASDSTNSLQNSGILTLDLETCDLRETTVFSRENYWLRASVKNPEAFPQAVAIYPQALSATWVDNGGAYGHLQKPLPANTISSSVENLPGIQAISQPLESFGGVPPETDDAFELRLGERLRHKDRAALAWDYERLVLERFPTVWKVQALPRAPGSVLVVVVPGLDSTQTLDPTAPLAASEMLGQVKTYLQQRASPFIQVQVVNPLYVRIRVTAVVEFQEKQGGGDSIIRLNNDLVQYLSPWFYDAARAAKAGEYASEDNIAEFIQTRPYVMALDSLELAYDPNPDLLEWCFFTSAKSHEIRDVEAVAVTTQQDDRQ